MFPLFISQQSSQKIALLLIQELLLQTLQLFFFSSYLSVPTDKQKA